MWRFTLTSKLLLALCLSVAGFVAATSPTYAATFTVTNTADTNDGTCDADCSLREAVAAANAAGGADTISFSIPGSDPNYNAGTDEWTITLGSSLSVSNNESLTVDGATQTGNGTFPTYGGKVVLLTTTSTTAISFGTGLDFNLDRLTFKNTSAASSPGSAILGSGTNVSITRSYFTRDAVSSTNNTVVAITPAGNLIFSNNKVDSYRRSFQATSSNAASTMTLNGNLLYDALSIGLRPTGYNITTSNNTVSNSGSDQAIVVACSGGTCTTSNNTVNTGSSSGFASIVGSGAGTHLISQNQITSANNYGIFLSSAGTIENNIVVGGSGSPVDAKIGVAPNDATKQVYVRNNTVTATNAVAVLVSGANTKAVVSQNNLTTTWIYTPLQLNGGTENPAKVTANDVGDADVGPNNLMNYPVIRKVVKAGNNLLVTADLDFKAAEGPFTIEFFDNDMMSQSGYGGGQYFIGSVTTSAVGSNRSLVVPITGRAPTSSNITATATNSLGMTSEFSTKPLDNTLHFADSSPVVYFDGQTSGGNQGKTRLYGTAVGGPTNIAAVQMSINGGSWFAASAVDGGFGAAIERFYSDFFPTDNGNTSDGYVVISQAQTTTGVQTNPAVYFAPFVISSPVDRKVYTSAYPEFTFTVNGQTSLLASNLSRYQIQVRPNIPGAAWQTLIDNIPINQTNINNRSYQAADFLALYSPDFRQVTVASRTTPLSGSYEWKVVAVDQAGNSQETATQTLYDGSTSIPGFPLAVVSIGGRTTHTLSTVNRSLAKSSYSTNTAPSFYGIAVSGSQVNLSLTDQNCQSNCTQTFSATTNGASRFSLQIPSGQLKAGRKYTAVFSAILNSQYTQLPTFTLQTN